MDHVSREFCLRLPALAATPWVVLKLRAQDMQWRGAARVEAIHLAEIVGEPARRIARAISMGQY